MLTSLVYKLLNPFHFGRFDSRGGGLWFGHFDHIHSSYSILTNSDFAGTGSSLEKDPELLLLLLLLFKGGSILWKLSSSSSSRSCSGKTYSKWDVRDGRFYGLQQWDAIGVQIIRAG
jgi:hypothetical protein